MSETIESCQYNTLRRAEGRCEGTIRENRNTYKRCPERLNQAATTFKGRVLLYPKQVIGGSEADIDNYKALCWKCLRKFEEDRHRSVARRPKKADPQQMNLF